MGSALSTQLWIPVAFRRVAFASETFLFPREDSAVLTVGLLPRATDSMGISTFRYLETRTGRMPAVLRGLVSFPRLDRGTWLHTWIVIRVPLTQHCRCPTTVPATSSNGASSQVHLRSSVRPFPSPVARMVGHSLDITPMLRDLSVTRPARRDWEQASWTRAWALDFSFATP